MNVIKITERQTPTFRAAIKSLEGDWFDATANLATQSELNAEGLDEEFPISFTVYKSDSSLSPSYTSVENATPVTGYSHIEIPSSAFISPADVEEDELDYNFQFTPDARGTFPFATSGQYFTDFLIYPKTGAAIAFRVLTEVK